MLAAANDSSLFIVKPNIYLIWITKALFLKCNSLSFSKLSIFHSTHGFHFCNVIFLFLQKMFSLFVKPINVFFYVKLVTTETRRRKPLLWLDAEVGFISHVPFQEMTPHITPTFVSLTYATDWIHDSLEKKSKK